MKEYIINMVLAMIVQGVCVVGLLVTGTGWMEVTFLAGFFIAAVVFWFNYGRLMREWQ